MQPVELNFLVDFVNEYAAEPRLRSGESDRPYPALSGLAAEAPVALGLAQAMQGNRSKAQLVELANQLHAVFARARSTPDRSLELVNTLLRESPATPHLSRYATRTIADWRVEAGSRSVAVLQAACALALHHWLTAAGSFDRLGVCRAHQCADIYVDGSQAASRRYCSASCGNRVKVAAHRARSRSQAAAGRLRVQDQYWLLRDLREA